MQQATLQESVEYASVSWRLAAVLVDTVVLVGLLIIAAMVYVFVLVAQGKIDPNDPAAVQALNAQLQMSNWMANVIVFGGLFVYYVVLESIFSASVGKLVLRLRVTMLDGSRPTGTAVLVRNLVRIPEAWLLYVPAGISCAAGARRQRLGDHAARTVVVRRVATSAATAHTPAPRVGASDYPSQPVAPAPPAAQAAPAIQPATVVPTLAEALARLKTAALAARGAHLNYLRFSERELAAGSAEGDGTYSEEYVSAWFTLTDTIRALGEARDVVTTVATMSELTPEAVTAAQPDLAPVLRELAPYFTARTDEEFHEAFLAVARSETAPPS